jgi:hypothetical protein
LPGSVVELGAPAVGRPAGNQLEFRNSAPNRKIQNDNALSRGNATSRAPIISGIR